MILKKLEIHGYGPFSSPATLEVDENVTVLTGQNDVGKSAILRLIRLLCSNIEPVEEDVNLDHKRDSSQPWNSDPEVYCRATFKVDENCKTYFAATNVASTFDVDVVHEITRKKQMVENIRSGSTSVSVDNRGVRRMPTTLLMPSQDEISPVFGFETANSLEKQFLTFAFGPNPEGKFPTSGSEFRTITMRQANRRVQETLNQILPLSLGLNLSIHPESVDPFIFSIHFEDSYNGLTTIGQRGAGIRKIVNLVTSLVTVANTSEFIYILMDEPENSLHADSQHKLRAFLENVATNPRIQVIYTTHSSSMINTLAPHTVRLLKRTTNDEGKATTRIDNHPYRDNFLSIRTSLGISPSDSLLFAAVSIIIEGDTEAQCLPYVFQKLEQEEIKGFEEALFRLSLSHFISAKGTSIELWCRLAKEQRAKPIVFLDGDKRSDLKKWRFDEKHPDVPQVLFPEKLEFENIVPNEQYIQALAVTHENDEISFENYNTWSQAADLPENMMFTKRITRWLKETFSVEEKDYNKPAVMKKAIELTPVEAIRTEELRKLLDVIEDEVGKL